jgi:hypothetical protein
MVRTVEFSGIDQPMLVVSFPGGGHLSIEFTDDAPDDDRPRLGAWLELRADDPAAVLRGALDAGLTEVQASRPSVLLHDSTRPHDALGWPGGLINFPRG